MGKLRIQNLSNEKPKRDYITDNNSEYSTKPQRHTAVNSKQRDNQILLYQIWPSANKFLCEGRLLQSQFPRPFLFAVILIFVPTIFHIVFHLTYGIYQIIFATLTYTFMFMTAFKDPGIVPRVQNLINDEDLDLIPLDRTNEKKEGFMQIDVNGYTSNYKVCDTCGIFKDRDRKHCRICDNCVSEFDHHCIWLNNCIGRNNYKNFIFFLFFLTLQIIFTLVSSAVYICNEVDIKVREEDLNRNQAIKQVLKKQPLPIILIIYSFVFLALVGTLLAFHIYAIIFNTTTVDFTKLLAFKRQRWQQYFQIKCWFGIKHKLLSSTLKPHINFRESLHLKQQCIKTAFTKEQLKKDSESATQAAHHVIEPASIKLIDHNIADFLSFNKDQILITPCVQAAQANKLKSIKSLQDNNHIICSLKVEEQQVKQQQKIRCKENMIKNGSLEIINIETNNDIMNF